MKNNVPGLLSIENGSTISIISGLGLLLDLSCRSCELFDSSEFGLILFGKIIPIDLIVSAGTKARAVDPSVK